MSINVFVICYATFILGAIALPENNDVWVEQNAQVSADPGGRPSNMENGCGPTGKCTSDIFCGAMPEFNIPKKTKGECIWGTNARKNAASASTAKGSIAEVYEKTGKCEYSVYGNPCFWKETYDYCQSLKPSDLNCPWYCNKEELYCAARYKNPSYTWEDEIGKGKCKSELNDRYDAQCDPLDWKFKVNERKLRHCRAHAFSRSCNNYYDTALKQYKAKQANGGDHDKNCKVSLKHHSCNPMEGTFLGKSYCNYSCSTFSELDGTEGSKNSYGYDTGCCDTLKKLQAEKAKADAEKAKASDKAKASGACKDDNPGLQKAWGDDYTCKFGKDMGYCGVFPEQDKYCKASCNKCGAEVEELVWTAAKIEALARTTKLVAERMKAKQSPKENLIEKYLREGYPDMPEMLPQNA